MNVDFLNDLKRKLNFLIKNSQYEKALSIANEILIANPKESNAYQIMGKIQCLLGNNEKSINYFLKALELDPKSTINYNLIAISLSNIGQNEEGLSYLTKDLQNGSNDPLTYYNMGIIYDKINNWDQALEKFHIAIKLKPYFPDACNNLGNTYYKKMEYKLAFYYLQKSINQNNKNSIAYHNLANCQRATGFYKDAIDNYNKALDTNPHQIESLNALGLTYYDISKHNDGIDCFKKIIGLNSKNYSAKRNLAIGYVKIGDVAMAITLLKDTVKNLPKCLTSICQLSELAEFEKSLDSKKLLNNFFECLQSNKLKVENNYNPIVLLGFGRSGSLFLHSLLDGHNEISTLPGYFFKGWFSEKTWPLFQPNYEDIQWRENLANKICNFFEPQFNANSKKNVLGKPNHHTEWLANNLGFTQLGKNRSEALELDQEKFKRKFIKLLIPFKEIDTRICFEMIHEAFDQAYRTHQNQSQKKKNIFYHLHNPTYFERASFYYHYPKSKTLFIVRNPIQMLESWLLTDLTPLSLSIKASSSYDDGYKFIQFLNSSNKIASTLGYFFNPLNLMNDVRGVKLEDLKLAPEKTLKGICDWIGIKDNPSLYQSTFMGKQFSRPSINFNNITGFDTRSIDTPYGRVFGPRDLEIIEILFWPFMNLYGYTKIDRKTFLKKLKEIRPHLDKPFQFEVEIYKKLPKDKPDISEINHFKELRKKIINIWETLNRTKTYPNLIKPLFLK